MILKLDVFDPQRMLWGTARLKLDWVLKAWSLQDDQRQVWPKVGFSRAGTFEPRDNGVIWIWDQPPGQDKHNTLIIQVAPTSEYDYDHRSGLARIFDPKDPSFKDGQVRWAVDPARAATVSAKSPDGQGLTPLRRKVLEICDWALPAYPAVAEPPNKITKQTSSTHAHVTNCGIFPGWVAEQIGGIAFAPEKVVFPPYNLKDGTLMPSTTAVVTSPMTEWSEFAKKVEKLRHAEGTLWFPFQDGSDDRPKPGDIYLLERPKGKGFAHVGIFISADGDEWTTADCGQGGGFAGAYSKRVFKPADGGITGEYGKPAWVRGWVNIDNLYPGWHA